MNYQEDSSVNDCQVFLLRRPIYHSGLPILKLRPFKFLPAFQRLTFNTSLSQSKHNRPIRSGVFFRFLFWWIHYCHSSKFTGKFNWQNAPLCSAVKCIEESVYCNAKQGRSGDVQEISVISARLSSNDYCFP